MIGQVDDLRIVQQDTFHNKTLKMHWKYSLKVTIRKDHDDM